MRKALRCSALQADEMESGIMEAAKVLAAKAESQEDKDVSGSQRGGRGGRGRGLLVGCRVPLSSLVSPCARLRFQDSQGHRPATGCTLQLADPSLTGLTRSTCLVT